MGVGLASAPTWSSVIWLQVLKRRSVFQREGWDDKTSGSVGAGKHLWIKLFCDHHLTLPLGAVKGGMETSQITFLISVQQLLFAHIYREQLKTHCSHAGVKLNLKIWAILTLNTRLLRKLGGGSEISVPPLSSTGWSLLCTPTSVSCNIMIIQPSILCLPHCNNDDNYRVKVYTVSCECSGA